MSGLPEHQPDLPRVLIIHDDPDMLINMLLGMNRSCCASIMTPDAVDADRLLTATCECAGEGGGRPCVSVITTLRQLHEFDLSKCDVVICHSSLADGSGLDALAYIRGICPDLPVMVSGEPSDTPLAVEAIRAGAVDFLVTTGGDLRWLPLMIEKALAHQRIRKENQHLHDDLSHSLSETALKNRQLQSLIHQLETMARTDDLTGLCNRRWLNLMLERSWSESLRHAHPLAFLMIDLDGFKSINDAFGHQRGDEMLKLTARVLDANCRSIDSPARYGGDEFCVLMPNTLPSEAAIVARRIQRAFDEVINSSIGQAGAGLGMSIGLSHVELSRPASAEQLIYHADQALYAAKSAGSNCVMVREYVGTIPLEMCRAVNQCSPELDELDRYLDAG